MGEGERGGDEGERGAEEARIGEEREGERGEEEGEGDCVSCWVSGSLVSLAGGDAGSNQR